MLNTFFLKTIAVKETPGKIFFVLLICRALKILSAMQILDCIFIFSAGQPHPYVDEFDTELRLWSQVL